MLVLKIIFKMMATKTVTGRNRLIKYRIQSYIYIVTITI